MHPALSKLRTILDGPLPILALVALLLVSLLLMSAATQAYTDFSRLYSLLLLSNSVALILLLGLIGSHLIRLIVSYRRREPGSRLRVRLLAMFVLLAVTPVTVVYYFSLEFLHRGIDSWFDVRVEEALDNALELSRAALDGRSRELLRQTELAAAELADGNEAVIGIHLDRLRGQLDATEMTLFTGKGRILSSSNLDPSVLVPMLPHDGIFSRLRQDAAYIGLDPLHDDHLHIRIAVLLPKNDPRIDPRILQAFYPVSGRMNELADGVQAAYTHYRELTFLRKPLKDSFTLTLSLALLLSVLAATWTAFLLARRLSAPISELAEGTRAVAAGDYSQRLQPPKSRDELSFLVLSFNQMVRKVERAQSDLNQSRRHAEEQHAYTEAILDHLSSGVLSLTGSERLVTTNSAARQILGVDLDEGEPPSLEQLGQRHPWLEPFFATLAEAARDGQEWQRQVVLFGANGRQLLMCRGAFLPAPQHGHGDHVVVFDDVTGLVQAQRDAAWGEVARRLAHEIKNPLTPIQLSAERLRHKLLPNLPPESAALLDRATHTIVQQVSALQEMVKAFSDYARPPHLQLQTVDLCKLIDEVLELYRGTDGKSAPLRWRLDCEAERPVIEADPNRLRQVLHNLLRNAIEANPQQPEVEIRVRCPRDERCNQIELRCCDNGPGFPDSLSEHLFEPYVSSKPKGTGLGLAVVKKIVEEHGGVLHAANRAEAEGGGACITIRLPVDTAQQRGER